MNTHTHSEHSQDFFGLLPAHSEAKGFVCHLQCVAYGDGWVTVEAVDVLVGDLKPLPVGIIDLRRGNNHAGSVSVAPYRMVMFVLCCVYRYFHPLLFCTAFVLNVIKSAFENNFTGLDLSHNFLCCCQSVYVDVSVNLCASKKRCLTEREGERERWCLSVCTLNRSRLFDCISAWNDSSCISAPNKEGEAILVSWAVITAKTHDNRRVKVIKQYKYLRNISHVAS